MILYRIGLGTIKISSRLSPGTMVDEESMSGLQLALEDGPQDSPVHLVPNHQVNK